MAEEVKSMNGVQQVQSSQALVLQQPNGEKIYFNIQHSTDTTAIWSFVVAMIASIVIAIWYGRKSFQLTEMSFKRVVEQIRSSEALISSSNENLIQQQKELEVLKKNIDIYFNKLETIRLKSAEVLIKAELINTQIYTLNDDFHAKRVGVEIEDKQVECLREEVKQLMLDIKLIQLFLDVKSDDEFEINKRLEEISLSIYWLIENITLTYNREKNLEMDSKLKSLENLIRNIISVENIIKKAT